MSEDVVYSDKKRNKEFLEFIVQNGKLPPYCVKTIGYLVRDSQKVGEGLLSLQMSMGENVYEFGENLLDNAYRLIAQKRRKLSDILRTMDYILGAAELVNLKLSINNRPNAKKFEEILLRFYKIRVSLKKFFEKHPDCTLEEASKKDVILSDIVESAYSQSFEELEPLAKDFLEENPEFKEKINVKFLTDLLVNMPIVTAEEINSEDFPSDVQILNKK